MVDQKRILIRGGQSYAMVIRDVCPRCQSPKFKKNGHIHNGKQNHHGHDCGRQFVDGFAQSALRADSEDVSPFLRGQPVARLRYTCLV
jgi:transposase-like protein